MLSSVTIHAEIQNLNVSRYNGSINDKYQINVVIFEYDQYQKGQLFGYYYYSKKMIPIYLTGEKSGASISLVEYADNGKMNAIFEGTIKSQNISGKWKYGNKELSFILTQSSDKNIDIHSASFGEFNIDAQNINGKLTINEEKKKIKISFDIYTKDTYHTGTTEGLIQLTANGIWGYEADIQASGIDKNCALFIIPFADRVLVYQYGNTAYLDFGAGVNAWGVYLKK
jgi:hypothetical protein